MAITVLPIDASAGSPSYSAQAFRQALSALIGPAPTGRPLGALSGVRPFTSSSTVFLSGGSNFTWNVAAHSGVLDTEVANASGPYLYATDGTDTGTITAADATNPRVDIIYVQVNDTVQDGSGLRNGVVGYLAGTPAASPNPPATPTRSIVLAQINVPKVGSGNPSATWTAATWGVTSYAPYSPTLTNVTLGNGSVIARYTLTNKTVDFYIQITFGSTTAFTASIQATLPPLLPALLTGWTAEGTAFDTSATAYFGVQGIATNSTTLTFRALPTTAGSNLVVVNASQPMTWATGDILTISGSYETA